MKPCTYEQDLLFAIHGEANLWQRLRLFFHSIGCSNCRERKREFLATSRLLLELRPAPALVPAGVLRPVRKRRLILCSAAVAIAAAAISYYVAFGVPWSGEEPYGPTGQTRLCAPDEEPQVVSIERDQSKDPAPDRRSKKRAR